MHVPRYGHRRPARRILPLLGALTLVIGCPPASDDPAITAVQADVGALQSDVADLQSGLADAGGALATAESDLADVEARLTAVEADVASVSAAAEATNLRVDDLEAADEATDLRVDDLEAADEAMDLRVDDLEAAAEATATELDGVDTALADLEAAAEATATELDGVDTALADLDSRLAEVEAALALAAACPAGMEAMGSVCLETGERAGASWVGALAACRDEGFRLCSAEERMALCNGPDLTPFTALDDNEEWTATLVEVADNGTGVAATAGNGTCARLEYEATWPATLTFRCCADLPLQL